MIQYVYALESNGVPFYIGITGNPEVRKKGHLCALKNKHTGGHAKMYFYFPESWDISVLDVVEYNEWAFWEKHYISLYKSWGFDLFNTHPGGLLSDDNQLPWVTKFKDYNKKLRVEREKHYWMCKKSNCRYCKEYKNEFNPNN